MRVTNQGRGFKGAAALALTLVLLVPTAAQQPRSAQGEEEVVRITSSLIQIDAVVLDSEGRQVTDLTAEDFELSEDGRAQAITNFSYVDNSPGAEESPAPASQPKGLTPLPPARLRPGGARRVV